MSFGDPNYPRPRSYSFDVEESFGSDASALIEFILATVDDVPEGLTIMRAQEQIETILVCAVRYPAYRVELVEVAMAWVQVYGHPV